jgi:hypothetical protein
MRVQVKWIASSKLGLTLPLVGRVGAKRRGGVVR